MTWSDVAAAYPEFVQWVVARFGPLPGGPVEEADYERYMRAYKVSDGGWGDAGPMPPPP